MSIEFKTQGHLILSDNYQDKQRVVAQSNVLPQNHLSSLLTNVGNELIMRKARNYYD